MLKFKTILKYANDKLLRKYFPLIVNQSKLYQGGTIDEDLFNEQLLKFYQLKDKYSEDKGNFHTYLYAGLKYNRIDYIKKLEQSGINNEILDDGRILRLIEDKFNLEQNVIDKELLNQLINFISNIPSERNKIIIEKRLFEDKTYREISNILQCSHQNVRQIYLRLLKKFKSELKEGKYEYR